MSDTEIDGRDIESLIFQKFQGNTRFTQDSPVYPDVWMKYFEAIEENRDLDTYRCDVILTPHRRSSSAELLQVLFQKLSATSKLKEENGAWELATTGESVAAKVTLKELITIILPLTDFWKTLGTGEENPSPSLQWLQELVGALLCAANKTGKEKLSNVFEKQRSSFKQYFVRSGFYKPNKKDISSPAKIWSVSKNRPAEIAIEKSVPATKADACRRVFDIDGSEITWAILDTGIDARHTAFRKTDPKINMPFAKPFEPSKNKNSNNTRIVATYDFTKFREVLVMAAEGLNNAGDSSSQEKKSVKHVTSNKDDQKLSPVEVNNLVKDAGKDLRTGRLLDWTVISPLLRIPHNSNKGEYMPPVHSHGTHVAGILGAGSDGKNGSEKLLGMCPGISLYDIRVMDDNGNGDEFNILAALQFVRWMNSQRDGIVIHGINLSLSLKHEVASFGCGQTPICISCERLVAEGTIVVSAAGNLGQALYQSTDRQIAQGFRMVNITDPGNAESVITVGSTHGNRPHSYGVSYFSSKGPTGDGRMKPDLIAPGEKIVSASIGNKTEPRDGTSMAAPHVSGAAALIIAKNRELIGKPMKVKEILCSTATDLGREKYFQGCGMLDVLRAIQSV